MSSAQFTVCFPATRCFAVEIASEPASSATRVVPAAMRSHSSLTKFCGESPPTGAQIASRGATPSRRAIECGKLFDLPKGVAYCGVECSKVRSAASVSISPARRSRLAASAQARRAASAASSTFERPRYSAASIRSVTWPTPTMTGVLPGTLWIAMRARSFS